MSTQRKNFILNLDLLDQKKSFSLSDSQLSLQLGKSRTWLNSVRRRKNSDGTVCIREVEAVGIARILNCLVQDIGTNAIEPMDIDFAAIANSKLKTLLREDQEFAAELLSWTVSADSVTRLLLLSALKTLPSSQVLEKSGSSEAWFRYLLIAQLGKALISDINETTERQIRSEFYHALPESASYDKKIQIMKQVLKPKVQKITGGFDTDYTNTVLDGCAKFLVRYLEGSIFPDEQALAELYKRGVWVFTT